MGAQGTQEWKGFTLAAGFRPLPQPPGPWVPPLLFWASVYPVTNGGRGGQVTAKGPSRRGGSRVWTRRAHRTSSTLRQASCGRQTQQTLQAAAAPQTLSSVLFSPSSTPPPSNIPPNKTKRETEVRWSAHSPPDGPSPPKSLQASSPQNPATLALPLPRWRGHRPPSIHTARGRVTFPLH